MEPKGSIDRMAKGVYRVVVECYDISERDATETINRRNDVVHRVRIACHRRYPVNAAIKCRGVIPRAPERAVYVGDSPNRRSGREWEHESTEYLPLGREESVWGSVGVMARGDGAVTEELDAHIIIDVPGDAESSYSNWRAEPFRLRVVT